MGTIGFADLDETVGVLKWRISRGERLVFLLGAGCSMQYGLPGFRQLLEHLGAVLGRPRYRPAQSLEAIREDLEPDWLRRLTAGERREELRKLLKVRNGRTCAGYMRLARLAKQGYVEAFVNMNFDVLLEDALAEEEVAHCVTNSFSDNSRSEIRVIKPHGSIESLGGVERNDPILDLAKSDLFTTEKERVASRHLFSAHDTVVLGYSGADQKMVDVLRPGERGEPKKLFIVNVAPPNRRLLLAAGQRDPEYFLTTGEEASFENFAEELDRASRSPGLGVDPTKPLRSAPAIEEFDLMTQVEREAFNHCLDLATRIWWWSSGAAGEGSELKGAVGPVTILQHAREVFDLVARLASASGLWLSSPEKHMVRCAGVLHDLGFFTSLQKGLANAVELRGVHTADFLEERLRRFDPLKPSLIPSSYEASLRESLIAFLLGLCRLDAVTLSLDDFMVEALGAPVRPRLVNILFTVGERLARRHAFLPPSEEVLHDNPALDLFQLWRQEEIRVEIEPRRMTAHGQMKEKEASWFLLTCRALMEDLEGVAEKHGGFGLVLDGFPTGEVNQEEALRTAHEQALATRIADVEPASIREWTSLLDLAAIFSLGSAARITPETSPAVSSVLTRIENGLRPGFSEDTLLAFYFALRREGTKSRLDSLFRRSFEAILYPAWRYLARRWYLNVDLLIPAEFSLEMGSSRYRSEVIPGLNQLLGEKVSWLAGMASGHEGCTQCTSRLLYIFGRAMLLFPREEIRDLVRDASGHTVEDAVRGMLLYFLSRRPDEKSWWGLGGDDEGRIVAPDYIAHAACAAVFCLGVDRELQLTKGESWLRNSCGIEREQVERLARERTDALLRLTREEIQRGDLEEPISRTLGMMGRLVLSILSQPRDLLDRVLPADADRQIVTLVRTMKEIEPWLNPLSMLSRLSLWPVDVLLDQVKGGSREDVKRRLALTCMECLSSPAWVTRGRAVGSWSFNVQNTYLIAGSLAAFWRHALAAENREEFAQLFEHLEGLSPE